MKKSLLFLALLGCTLSAMAAQQPTKQHQQMQKILRQQMKQVCRMDSAIMFTGDGIAAERMEPIYNEDGVMVCMVVSGLMDLENNIWSLLYKDTLLLDAQGREAGDISYNWNMATEEWVPGYKFEKTYDEFGNVNMEQEFEWDTLAAAWVGEWRDEFVYDALEGNILSFTSKNWDSAANDWYVYSTYTDAYSADGEQISHEAYEVNYWSGIYGGSSKWEYIFSGDTVSYIQYRWDSETESWLNQMNTVTITENGLVTKITYRTDNAGGWIAMNKEYEEQDVDGSVTKYTCQWDMMNETWGDPANKEVRNHIFNPDSIIKYRWYNETWDPTGKQVYTYDAAGNILQFDDYQCSANVFNQIRSEMYDYNEAGQLLTKVTKYQDYATQTLVNNSIEVHAYDEAGNVTLNGYGSWDATLEIWKYYTYQEFVYDEAGNRTMELVKSWDYDNNVQVNDYKYEYAFDALGNQTLDAYYTWDAETQEWVCRRLQETEFDDQGNFLHDTYSEWDDEAGELVLETEVIYYYTCVEDALEGIEANVMGNTAKVIVNGQMYIVRDGKMYTAQGQLVK